MADEPDGDAPVPGVNDGSEQAVERIPMASLRSPEQVMRLSRMGSFHQSRLSFMRVLLRRFQTDGWRFERHSFEVDENLVGHAVYLARGAGYTYALVAFAHDLPDALRSDRVIADAWDATFTLHDGVPGREEIARLRKNTPRQEAGRFTCRDLCLSRANRSARLWQLTVDALASGRQPDLRALLNVGYLMRTTAVYANGKFGLADREAFCRRPGMEYPFAAELLSVYLIRAFVFDLVEHAARVAGGVSAIGLSPDLRRRMGIGNSTGLGMAPFLAFHPRLLHRWVAARETALARIRAVRNPDRSARVRFRQFLYRAALNARQWNSEHPLQISRLQSLRADLDRIAVKSQDLEGTSPWDALVAWSERELGLEGQEQLVSLLLELYPALVDNLADRMAVDENEPIPIDGGMSVGVLKSALIRHYGWALEIDFDDPGSTARFWYVSSEKLEPRLGERYEEPGAEYEQPQNFARDASRLWKGLDGKSEQMPIADFLLTCPEHRQLVERVQFADRFPYAEIRDNLISAEMRPIDLLRCKLSFFGATRFDPRSDRWVRICMYQNAPLPEELAGAPVDDWAYPQLDETCPTHL